MKKFRVNVDGKTYEVEIEDISEGACQGASAASFSSPVVATPPTMPVGQGTPAPVVAVPNVPATPAPVANQTTAAEKPSAADNASDGTPVEAPVTGQIIKINVKVGDSVEEGQVLLILEAMKMENEVTAPVSGSVSQVLVNSGNAVDAGQNLVVIK